MFKTMATNGDGGQNLFTQHGNRNMTKAQSNDQDKTLSPEAFEEMAKYGIKRVSVEYFYFGMYGYRDLNDALAQAKRERKLTHWRNGSSIQ